MKQNKINNDSFCKLCKNYMEVKEQFKSSTNIYAFCILNKDIDCNAITGCNQWTSCK